MLLYTWPRRRNACGIFPLATFIFGGVVFLYLLYLDESGQHGGHHFVLGGVAVFERQTFWIATRLDQLQQRFLPNINEPIEFHASSIRAGKESPWDSLQQNERYQLLDNVYEVIQEGQVVLFGTVIERAWLEEGSDEYDYAFESMVNRFDRFLRWKYKEEGEAQRGLIIIAESQYRQRLEVLARRIREKGTRWGEAYNLADIPLFSMATNSRLLQVADFCANAIWGRFEHSLARQFDFISSKFFQSEGIVHGLAHYSTGYARCTCPACLTRKLAKARPPWEELTT
jgi:hypothetical protein